MKYPIMRVDPFMASVVRLTNLHSRPEESQIAATCELFGRVEKVVVRSETMVDVYFQTSETKKMPRILNRWDTLGFSCAWDVCIHFCKESKRNEIGGERKQHLKMLGIESWVRREVCKREIGGGEKKLDFVNLFSVLMDFKRRQHPQ